jgi:hypothetical protein
MLKKKSAGDRPCAQCGQLGAKNLCTQCQQVCYCDRECQRAHWPQGAVHPGPQAERGQRSEAAAGYSEGERGRVEGGDGR